MGRGGRWQAGRGRGAEGPGGRGWRPTGPPAPPAGQPKLDPKIIEQRRQNTASRLRRFLQPLRISPSLAGEEAMTEFNELMQVCVCDIVSSSMFLLSQLPFSALFSKRLRVNGSKLHLHSLSGTLCLALPSYLEAQQHVPCWISLACFTGRTAFTTFFAAHSFLTFSLPLLG